MRWSRGASSRYGRGFRDEDARGVALEAVGAAGSAEEADPWGDPRDLVSLSAEAAEEMEQESISGAFTLAWHFARLREFVAC